MNGPSSSVSSCIVGSPISAVSVSVTVWNDTSVYWARFAHRKTPTLSTCEVARKSFVGEKERLVATLGVLNASINRPVGISNVRMMESKAAATSHRESGEKVYSILLSRRARAGKKQPRTTSSIRPRNPFSSLTILRVSMSTIRRTRSSQITASRPLSRCSRIEVAAEGKINVSSSWVV
jgi:hypothetical protein